MHALGPLARSQTTPPTPQAPFKRPLKEGSTWDKQCRQIGAILKCKLCRSSNLCQMMYVIPRTVLPSCKN